MTSQNSFAHFVSCSKVCDIACKKNLATYLHTIFHFLMHVHVFMSNKCYGLRLDGHFQIHSNVILSTWQICHETICALHLHPCIHVEDFTNIDSFMWYILSCIIHVFLIVRLQLSSSMLSKFIHVINFISTTNCIFM